MSGFRTIETGTMRECIMCPYIGTATDHIGQCPSCGWDELRRIVFEPERMLLTSTYPKLRDISSAPKDGTRILLARCGWQQDMGGLTPDDAEWRTRLMERSGPWEYAIWWLTIGVWSDRWNKGQPRWMDGGELDGLADPSHWAPLPATPKPHEAPPQTPHESKNARSGDEK